ncbi:MAG: ArsR/SmtB family transcription factor [Candidatus Paceibacterota bacterium]
MVKYYKTTLNSTFDALSDARRRELLFLIAKKDLNVTELASCFSVSLPAISRHLKVLEKAGVIKRRIRGREHYFDIVPKALADACNWITEL